MLHFCDPTTSRHFGTCKLMLSQIGVFLLSGGACKLTYTRFRASFNSFLVRIATLHVPGTMGSMEVFSPDHSKLQTFFRRHALLGDRFNFQPTSPCCLQDHVDAVFPSSLLSRTSLRQVMLYETTLLLCQLLLCRLFCFRDVHLTQF